MFQTTMQFMLKPGEFYWYLKSSTEPQLHSSYQILQVWVWYLQWVPPNPIWLWISSFSIQNGSRIYSIYTLKISTNCPFIAEFSWFSPIKRVASHGSSSSLFPAAFGPWNFSRILNPAGLIQDSILVCRHRGLGIAHVQGGHGLHGFL